MRFFRNSAKKNEAQLMKFEPVRELPAKVGAQPMRSRSYSVATNAPYISWDTQGDGNSSLFSGIATMRRRCRDLARNNDFIRYFLRLAKSNVIGNEGLRLSVVRFDGDSMDRNFCRDLENHWKHSGKVKHSPSVCGQMTRREIAELWLHNLIVDGEVFEIFSPNFSGNRYRYASKIVDSSLIDWTKNETLSNGNRIVMGVELDENERHVAYWVNQSKNDVYFSGYGGGNLVRIPATNAKLSFLREFAGQVRGVSWVASPAIRTHMLQKFEEATLIASRAAASRGGFYKINEHYEGESLGVKDGQIADDSDFFRETLEPSFWQKLPLGVEPVPHNAQLPTDGLQNITASMLRSISSGLGIQYVTLANNLDGVTYSSIRSGELEQRGIWKSLQAFAIEHHAEPNLERWLTMQTLTNNGLDFAKLIEISENDETRRFIGRGWTWIDPLKEITAKKEELKLGLTTRSRIVAESSGQDYEDLLDEIENENKMMIERGLDPRIDIAIQAVVNAEPDSED